MFEFDVEEFRVDYKQFADDETYPDDTLQRFWNTATVFISPYDCGVLNGDARLLAINLLTAHLAAISVRVNAGKLPNLPQSATVDKISVSMTPPPVNTQFAWWYNLTSYGAELLTLLEVAAVGGLFFGGAPNRAAFRGPCG